MDRLYSIDMRIDLVSDVQRAVRWKAVLLHCLAVEYPLLDSPGAHHELGPNWECGSTSVFADTGAMCNRPHQAT